MKRRSTAKRKTIGKRGARKEGAGKGGVRKRTAPQGREAFIGANRTILVCLLLVAATLAVYYQVLDHDFINLDDPRYVTENPRVKQGLTPGGVLQAFVSLDPRTGNWHPLTTLSHMLDCQLAGLDPAVHHLTSLLFHLANGVLLLLVLQRMTGAFWRSAFAAGLFALHPLHVESVAWVTERKDVLSAFFWLLTMLAHARYARRPDFRRYILVVVLFALGLMSKSMLVTLPFVLLLMDYWPLGRLTSDPSGPHGSGGFQRERILPLVREKIPLFALTAVAVVLTVLAQRKGEAVASLGLFPLAERAANALVSYVKYIGMMAWPRDLGIYYPHPETTPAWLAAGAGVLLIGLTVALIWPWRKHPYLATGWLWWLGTLTPVIGIVQVGSQAMADRFTYIPSIGLFIAVAWGVPALATQWRHRAIGLGVAAVATLSVFLVLAWTQAGYWKNSVSILTRTLNVTTDNPMIHHLLGEALMARNEREEAVLHYMEVLRIAPEYAETGSIRQNLGAALMHQGKYKEAVIHFREAVKLAPGAAEPRNNLAAALMLEGKPGEAIVLFKALVEAAPDFPRARKNLVKAYGASAVQLLNQGKSGEAAAHFREALKWEPDNADIHGNLAVALAREGDPDGAISHFQAALKATTGPDAAFIHFNLASTFAGQGRLAEAVAHYREVLNVKPDNADAHLYLGVVLTRQERAEEAISHFREALRQKPNFPAALEQLEKAMGEAGDR